MVQVILFIMFAVFAHTAHGACTLDRGYVMNSNSQSDCMSRCQELLRQTAGNCGSIYNYSGVGYCTWDGFCKGHAYCGCNSCQAGELECNRQGGSWNTGECRCVVCAESDTTFKESSCAYDPQQGKYLNIVNTVTRTDCEVTVKEDKYYSLTCDTTCNENSELTCMGSIDGVTVYLRSCNGKVSRCEADGSCDAAIRKVAMGECENPNSPPNGNNSSSSSEQGSSSSGGNAADSLGWLKDSLRVIHVTDSAGFAEVNNNLENIQPFVAGTYDQVTDISGTVHDINSNLLTGFEFLNDIKENTGNTANNTNNINSKLTNTNQLLTDLNNKSWSVNVRPEITVEGDTNIINVSGDTAKSGFEILQYLKRIFGSDTSNNYNPNDTAGTGAQERSLMNKIDSALTDTMPVMNGDSVQAMGDRMRGSYRAIMDSIGNSAISDSMNRWSEAITDNGVITGNGSDNCPDVLTQTFDIDFPIGGTVSIGPLGVYLCRPVAGLGITFWALCRVILRAMVAIFAMIWLYKSVLGIDGGSDDEN